MSTIRNTVQSAVPGIASDHRAGAALGALEAREQAITDALLDFATSKGANAHEVKAVFARLDMSMTPEAPATPATLDEQVARLAEMVTTLSNRLDDALAFASRHGYAA